MFYVILYLKVSDKWDISKKVSLPIQNCTYLRNKWLNLHYVKSTTVNNNWLHRHTSFPSLSSTFQRVSRWGQSCPPLGEGGGVRKTFFHGTGLINQTQRTMCKPETSMFTVTYQFLLSAWEVCGKLSWMWSGKCRLYRKSSLGHLHVTFPKLQLPAESWLHLALWDFGNLIGPFTTQVSHL